MDDENAAKMRAEKLKCILKSDAGVQTDEMREEIE